MRTSPSLFARYLLVHFLLGTLLPVLVFIASAGVFPSVTNTESPNPYQRYFIVIGLLLTLFLVFSWLFFYRIRKRLLHLQIAMDTPADGGIPRSVDVGERDEIGRLGDSFNRMLRQLEQSRQREQEEEELRRALIANLSHDLRTPLTAIRGHAYRLKKEALTPAGRDSLDSLDHRVTHMGQLVDDLLSYTLLTSGKYPYRPQKTDMVRLVRASVAAWYPVFEGEGFRMDTELPEASFYWEIDPLWMERILDNYYQNINRHASVGKYIGVRADAEREWITIEDRGPGMDSESADKGAGIGLTIAELMLEEMKLCREVVTTVNGTTIRIFKN